MTTSTRRGGDSASSLLRRLPATLRDADDLGSLLSADLVAVPERARAFFIAGLARLTSHRPILVGVPEAAEAERLARDLGQLLGGGVELFPAWETLPFERVSPAVETMGRRLRVIWRLRSSRSGSAGVLPRVIVAPVRALVQRLGPHVEEVEPLVVEAGARLDRDDLVATLVARGYRREYQVEARGEVAVRGSIVDVYPSTEHHPVRIDLWGDEVDRLQRFSIADQRAAGDVTGVRIFPCRELLPTDDVRARARVLLESEPWGARTWELLSEGAVFDGMESWLPWLSADEHLLTDLLPPEALVALVEPRQMRGRAQDLLDEEASLASSLATTWGADPRRPFPRLSLDFDRLLAHTTAPTRTIAALPDSPSTPYLAAGAFDPVDVAAPAARLASLLGEGYRLLVVADGLPSAERLAEGLGREGVVLPVERLSAGEGGVEGGVAAPDLPTSLDEAWPLPGEEAGELGRSLDPGGAIVVGPLDHGFVAPGLRLAIVTEPELMGRRRTHRTPRAARRVKDFYEDLEIGSFVVHRQHGVARFEGMVTRAIGGVERDYLLLAYKGGDKLYVPTDQVEVVRRYTGGDAPALHRMGGADFQRARSRAHRAAREIADELVALYRERVSSEGYAFSPDTPWQHELEDAFPYEETPDQQRAIDEVKADMELATPMDRLVCGDVGYGKTEVAVRAAFKAVQDGKQVAVLVPTTLLANQHGETFRERFAGFPVRVEILSRFLTAAEQARTMADLATGSVDVVIGTHRLLSEDVSFKDLGLLVVDEEQRFGVSHKERIKQLRAHVDVLAMSATPIPRTLEMSLTGIRDLSVVNTPPEDRQPVLTYVGEYDEGPAAEAIRRELLREGQVFFVHNRVDDIDDAADHVRELVPEARVAVAHGQMDEGSLERTVLDFADHKHDVLVCTTIIESGIDMPTVNTLVVDRADLLGLAQLYQLRGRVGRSGRRAYAYLFWPRGRELSDDAYERLKTIGEHTALGSGFKIAMRDLEIRGAGNVLGADQSGHIAAVGFDLYCEMVTEAVREAKGEKVPEPGEITIDLPIAAFLPRDYVSRDDLRMEAYRRLASVATPAEVDDIRSEWLDRFGPIPAPGEGLLAVAGLRAECLRLGLHEVSAQRGRIRLFPLALKASEQVRLARLAPGAVWKESGEVVLPERTVPVGELVDLLQELVPPPSSPVPSAP